MRILWNARNEPTIVIEERDLRRLMDEKYGELKLIPTTVFFLDKEIHIACTQRETDYGVY